MLPFQVKPCLFGKKKKRKKPKPHSVCLPTAWLIVVLNWVLNLPSCSPDLDFNQNGIKNMRIEALRLEVLDCARTPNI